MKLQIQRSIQINAKSEMVYKIISDFHNWNFWSPWNHCEPTSKTEVSGSNQVGQSLTWSGEIIGSGKMTLIEMLPNQKILLNLEFYKPWKSFAQVVFTIKALNENKSELTWTMNTKLPFFMIFFKKMMSAYMTSDFDRGLQMLKEFIETGKVMSKSVYSGEKEYAEFYVLGKRTNCFISEIAKNAKLDFEELTKKLKSGEFKQPDKLVTVSHVHDIPNGICEYTAGLVYHLNKDLKVPTNYELFKISKHKGLTVDHYGPYRFIVNAWSMAVSYQRGLKKKIVKAVPAYEIYQTMPGQVDEENIHTQIILPIQ